MEVAGLRIALIAVAEREFSIASSNSAGAAPLDIIQTTRVLRETKKHADFTIIYLHGGNEYFGLPRPGLRETARFFVEFGANAVVCAHSHVPAAYEWYNGSFISYGLGNFIFDHSNPPKRWDIGYGVSLIISVDKALLESVKVVPYQQSVSLGGAAMLSGTKRESVLLELSSTNDSLQNEEEYIAAWSSFCDARGKVILPQWVFPFSLKGIGKLWKIAPFRKLLEGDRKKRLVRRNLIECPSHREVLTRTLTHFE